MLTTLRIADFAILQAAELPLGAGLTAVTGETGAGKSILLDALAAVLGGRASERFVRHGCDTAEIEALFEPPFGPKVLAVLDEVGIAVGEALVLRRVIGKGAGKNRCYINGRLATVQVLRQVAAPLVDLSAQHAQHRLLEPAAHLELLDRYGGSLGLRQACDHAHAQWRKTTVELEELRRRQTQAAERLDWLRFVHNELSELAPKAGELAEIGSQLQKLRAAEQLSRVLTEAAQGLGSDGGIRETASKAARGLAKLAHIDPSLGKFSERLGEIEALAGDLDFDLSSYARSVRRDDRQMGRLAERQDQLTRAVRKHGGSEEALLARLAQVSAELDADQTELRAHELERETTRLLAEFSALADELSEKRHLAAQPLAAAVAEVLQQLGMAAAGVRFAIRADRAQPTATGFDSVDLYFRANRGEAEGLLHQVASGGELSRVLLAVQRALGDAAWSQLQLASDSNGKATGDLGVAFEPLPTAIFDEADAGLSGATGLVLGRFMAEIAARQQVIVISHLPQVAAAADAHVAVSKDELEGRTRSRLSLLQGDDRVAELARMLGALDGQAQTAVAHAKELLRAQSRQT